MMHNNKFLGFWTILKKEVIDNLRDRRTLTTMGISIIVGPLLMFGFLWFIEKTVNEETDLVSAKPIELPVLGASKAPNLMNWLAQNNIEVVELNLDAASDQDQAIDKLVSEGEQLMILKIGADFATSFEQSKTAPLRLIHDSSISGVKKIGFSTVQQVLARYSSTIGQLRLQMRGINPQIIRPIQVNISDVATAEARNSEILTMMPYLIVIFIMVGGMYLAIDTTAGERENGSLEPLLSQPVKRSHIMLAKLSATAVFSALTFLLVLIGLALSFKYVPIESITVSVDSAKVLIIFLTCLPFVFVACALMVLIASFTKSYKEAQSYLGMVMLVPSLPLVMLGILAPEPSVSNMWVPSLSQGLIIIETIKGEAIASPLIAMSMLSSLLFAALLSYVAVKLYQHERILG